ncbi:hypothetical protein BD779DRAFT_744091 [Infundibulicybe gibba]|nr:hypothetical protein BD779DRAFT_537362 [Infundibulicybe gibba]KAF8895670.1 hypothetical protein BD779DRAFT_744091 [Infundibulicybe gibba]
MYILPVVSALASVSLVSAKVLNVLVGINGVNNFMPTAVLADAGDTIMFQFAAKNHSVTQSSFDHPCQPLAGGVSSPFFNVQTTDTMAPEWGFTVDDTSPKWFYCAQTIPASHCSREWCLQ